MADEHVHTEHPLKLNFHDYLSHLTNDELKTRLGAERYACLMDGTLDTTEYLPPAQGERFTIDDLKRADIDSFIIPK